MNIEEQKRIFEDWMKNHKGLLFKFVRAYAFNAEDQNDLFQEISLQVWRSIKGFKRESAATTWIYRVAMNTAIAWNRDEKKHQAGKEQIRETNYVIKNLGGTDPRLEWLYEQIAGLNKVDRAVTMLMLDGYNYREMANMLGISESNVGVKINRIKKKLVKQSQNLEYQKNGI